ncbi:MAG: hypothetical protein ACM357_08500 [Gemmatimonadota bacterium]
MVRIAPLLLLGGLLGTPLAAGLAQDRARPVPRREAPAPERAPRQEPPRAEPRREVERARPERAEPRRDAPAERREPSPRSTGEPELRRRRADKPD